MPTRRPSLGVWIIAAVVMLAVAYPLSLGPACWIIDRDWVGPGWPSRVYAPLLDRTIGEGYQPRGWDGHVVNWYASLWSERGWSRLWYYYILKETGPLNPIPDQPR